MTPEDQRRHIGIVRELSVTGGPLDKNGPNATISNPAWFYPGTGVPRRERRELHERLKQEVRDQVPHAQEGNRALVLAGPPGAGKGRVAGAFLGEAHEQYVNVDADEFKKLLLREAIADGSFESWIKPDAVRAAEAAGEQFYPLELASLVHEESSMLAVQLREDLIATGTNIVVDTVLGNEEKAIGLGQQFTVANYRVAVVDVEVPYEVSESRIVHRWNSAMLEAEAGKADALGGRWVPSTYARPLFATEHGRSKSQDVAETFAEACPVVERYERHFTSWEEHSAALQEDRTAVPTLEVVKVRSKAGGELQAVAKTGTLSKASFPGAQMPGQSQNASAQRPPQRPERGRTGGIER